MATTTRATSGIKRVFSSASNWKQSEPDEESRETAEGDFREKALLQSPCDTGFTSRSNLWPGSERFGNRVQLALKDILPTACLLHFGTASLLFSLPCTVESSPTDHVINRHPEQSMSRVRLLR
jgi:hypothetical protein